MSDAETNARIENIHWLVTESSAPLGDVCARLNVSADALEKFCDRHDIYPVWQRLKHRSHAYNDSCPLALPPIPPMPIPPEEPMTDTITELIERGQDHASKRVQTAADRAEEAIEKLRELLDAEDAKAETVAEITRLERELAEARARLRPRRQQTATATPTRVDNKAIRAWAKAEGIDCPDRGRVPQRVVDAYTHQQAS